jgi:hypothetical protein
VLQHKDKFIVAAFVTFIAVYVPFHLWSSATPRSQAALRTTLNATAHIARVHIATFHQPSHDTSNSSITYNHAHYNDQYPNSSSQPSPSLNSSASPSAGPPPKAQCIHQAIATEPTKQEIADLLGHQLRSLPPTDSSSPVLSTSNWEGLASEEHAGDLCSIYSPQTLHCNGHVCLPCMCYVYMCAI